MPNREPNILKWQLASLAMNAHISDQEIEQEIRYLEGKLENCDAYESSYHYRTKIGSWKQLQHKRKSWGISL